MSELVACRNAEAGHAIDMYEGVIHALNDTAEARYDQVATELAWSRTFFGPAPGRSGLSASPPAESPAASAGITSEAATGVHPDEGRRE